MNRNGTPSLSENASLRPFRSVMVVTAPVSRGAVLNAPFDRGERRDSEGTIGTRLLT